MANHTEISWTDATFNPWTQCTPVSPGCKNCYASALSKRFGNGEYAAGKPRKRTSAKYLRDAIKMAHRPFYECKACGWRGDNPNTAGGSITDGLPSCPDCDSISIADARRRIFSLSLGDWLDNEVPIDWFADMLDAIRTTPESDWLLLTKRIGNWKRRIGNAIKEIDSDVGDDLRSWLWSWINGHPPANVWLGATVVNQEEADRDVPKLLDVPARIRFLSIEPMLGPINLDTWPQTGCSRGWLDDDPGLDWVVCGGESGPHARQLDMQWIRSLVLQCKTAGVPIHVKQMGRTPFFGGEGAGWAYDFFGGGDRHWRADYRLPDGSLGVCAFRDREGRNINEWPEDLRVQEFPA